MVGNRIYFPYNIEWSYEPGSQFVWLNFSGEPKESQEEQGFFTLQIVVKSKIIFCEIVWHSGSNQALF